MARPQDAHLTGDEIARLASSTPGPGEGKPEGDLDAARRHLDSCPACRAQMEESHAAARQLAGLKLPGTGPRGDLCPPDDLWPRLAAGTLREKESGELMSHAAECDHCGALLREAVEDFALELSPEEQAALRNLASAGAEWQRQLAVRLSALSRATRQGSVSARDARAALRGGLRWAFAAAIVLAIALGIWWTLSRRGQSADALLARAYTEQRPFELRIPGAGYAPLRQERGAERSRLSKPAALLQAEAFISEKLAANPNDPQLLASRGRAELLESQFPAAIESLKRALAIHPDLSSAQVDLATAYSQRAQTENSQADLGQAIEILGQVLATHPDDSVALFNRALVYEQGFLYHQAVADWERYLQVDPRGEWANESRRRLEELRARIKAREQSSGEPLADPAAAAPLLRARADGKVAGANAWPDSFDEEYLRIAITNWLPALYSTAGGKIERNAAAGDALDALSRILSHEHGDRWLADLLQARASASLVSGLQSLSRAERSLRSGTYDAAQDAATRASQSLRAAGSAAGSLRADLAALSSLERIQQPARCLNAAAALSSRLARLEYPFLESNAALAEVSCLNQAGRAGQIGPALNRALELAQAHRFGASNLRALAAAAGIEYSRGNFPAAWNNGFAGLQHFWSGTYPALRGYEFCAILGFAAENSGRWHASQALAREAVSQIARTPDRLTEAVARQRLAIAENMLGDTEAAAGEFRSSREMLAALPQTEVTRLARLTVDIYLASLESRQGRLREAESRLQEIRPGLSDTVQSWTAQSYFQTLGEISLRRGNAAAAEEAFRRAILLAESVRGTLRSEAERLRWEREASLAYRELVRVRAENQHDPVGALNLWEWYRASAIRAATPPAPQQGIAPVPSQALPELPPLPDISRLAAALKKVTVLSYALYPDGLAVWAYDDRGVDFRWVPVPAPRMEDVADRFAALCADPHSDLALLHRDARQLYDWLLAPVAARLDASRALVIESDGPIGSIPLSALLDPSGAFLGSRMAILHSPGIEFEQALRPAAPFTRRDRALLVAVPAPGGDAIPALPRLPDAESETQAIAGGFDHPTLLTGAAATRAALEQELLRADLFHFAGHATVGAAGGQLLLAAHSSGETSTLTATEIAASPLRSCRLAVLSACSTATSENGLEDPQNLVRAFLRAGVTHVLASRWRVDSAATRLFMTAFYRRLLAGERVERAAQAAADELRRSPATAHPYYWSAFSAYGGS